MDGEHVNNISDQLQKDYGLGEFVSSDGVDRSLVSKCEAQP